MVIYTHLTEAKVFRYFAELLKITIFGFPLEIQNQISIAWSLVSEPPLDFHINSTLQYSCVDSPVVLTRKERILPTIPMGINTGK